MKYTFLLMLFLAVGCQEKTNPEIFLDTSVDVNSSPDKGDKSQDTNVDTTIDEPDVAAPLVFTTEADLKKLYNENGGVDAFPAHHVSALEALLYGEDDLKRGDIESARSRVDAIFKDMPLSTPIWYQGAGYNDLHYGRPIAYYGLRMLDQILRFGTQESIGTLQMTAVVAKCANIERPTLPNFVPETVTGNIDPRILEDDAKLLHDATHLFRRWVRAITGGMDVELVVQVIETCSTVTFNVRTGAITSYPDANEMISAVPTEISNATDFWWVVTPSGVPGDGSTFEEDFITGGMGVYGANRPLFLSDDKWFTRKPAHLGKGEYSQVEVRAYQPQWFQHEFMHHLYRSYPELGLEDDGHQWFDRTTWPADFVGEWEPDYYIESVDKRLLRVQPPMNEMLKGPRPFDASVFSEADLVGEYKRMPVENEYHEVTISANPLTWSNAANVSWSLELRDDGLFSGADGVYGELPITIETTDGKVATLWFNGGAYQKVD